MKKIAITFFAFAITSLNVQSGLLDNTFGNGGEYQPFSVAIYLHPGASYFVEH